MEISTILKTVDHTVLDPAAAWPQIKEALDDAVRFGTATACIPPSYVKRAKQYIGDAMKIGTVVGFPNGYSLAAVKVFEASAAIADGADEIDMVNNTGWLKDGRLDEVREEIAAVKKACGDKVLKVIIETCLLTDEEKIAMCRIVTEAGADYIKTSTGFWAAGATVHDILLFAGNIGPGVKIKAAGGISSLEDARQFLNIGADRLGTSRIIKILKNQEGEGY
ncbi:MAG: deoxyribose-phosphate aldolase [Oscillospiraceae bacterium]|nr:deoxyribose-phosphate aldolase [Oscillospiraceae bacterium]